MLECVWETDMTEKLPSTIKCWGGPALRRTGARREVGSVRRGWGLMFIFDARQSPL